LELTVEAIQEALKKAKASEAHGPADLPEPRVPAAMGPYWSPPRVVLDPEHLERNRIVSYGMTHPSHIAFNLLRTKIYKTMQANGWKSLAVVSPTVGCGKTTVALNLAFSMARQSDCRTVLVDLDLKKSAMAHVLGAQAKSSIGLYLQGQGEAEECFIEVTQNLSVGINSTDVTLSAEALQSQKSNDLLLKVKECLRPDIVIFDLPPMLSSDDAIAFLPRVDCSILVVASGTTIPNEIAECERQVETTGNFLGVVLNKCPGSLAEYGGYGYGPESVSRWGKPFAFLGRRLGLR
jgi:protein-tyrosine kinase